jgi:hypothetical protein
MTVLSSAVNTRISWIYDFVRVRSHAWQAGKERSLLYLVKATKDGDKVQCDFNYVPVHFAFNIGTKTNCNDRKYL